MNFRQLPMRPVYLMSTFVNFLYGRETLCEIPSTFLVAGTLLSTFHSIKGPSVNFLQLFVWPGDLLSTFCVARRTSVNFR